MYSGVYIYICSSSMLTAECLYVSTSEAKEYRSTLVDWFLAAKLGHISVDQIIPRNP
jgi:hypothetical protein